MIDICIFIFISCLIYILIQKLIVDIIFNDNIDSSYKYCLLYVLYMFYY